MHLTDQGWLIFKTDQGWEMKTVSSTYDLISAVEGTYWLQTNAMPKTKSKWADWNYAFHRLPLQVLSWALLLDAQTLPVNHHDPHNNPKSDKDSPEQSAPDTPPKTYPHRHT